MSRIGRKPIPIPKGVEVEIRGNVVRVRGPKGELTREFHPDMTIVQEDGYLLVKRPTDQRHHRALHGLTRALLNNMVVGVSTGFRKVLEIVGVGYRAQVRPDGSLLLNLGFSHPVEVKPPENVTFHMEPRSKEIVIEGIDKQVVGQVAADIRRLRPPEPYKGKGIRYKGEQVRRKAGKAGKAK
ncbi:MAG: 50S ribosomal protein L6 [Chloroflexi bacterium]|nr:MAG: 50S ribosomal protein L6 [Chloroflexota bacterium]